MRVIALLLCLLVPSALPPDYSIRAVRYATIPQFSLASLIPGAPADQRLDIAMVVWVIQGDGRTILFDSGFFRQRYIDQFKVTEFIRPDSALALAGVPAADVTDIIVSHAHWDHMGGIDLFPKATIWIQKDEYQYYTGEAWQQGGRRGGIDTADVQTLVRRNMAGKVKLVAGDNVEILPGIRAYTGSRHTYASQYIRVDGTLPFVLASDNAYLFRNINNREPSATFTAADRNANIAAIDRMIQLAGSSTRVVPGHDATVFKAGQRVAVIR